MLSCSDRSVEYFYIIILDKYSPARLSRTVFKITENEDVLWDKEREKRRAKETL